ncbi:MAG: hypothetical protein K9K68_07095, partial [Methylococcaceae bacterium]|nr:hypothetical protein [Methylococcaceae bacterium]
MAVAWDPSLPLVFQDDTNQRVFLSETKDLRLPALGKSKPGACTVSVVVRFSKTITVRGEPFGSAQESLVEPLLPANIGLRQAQAERIICNR